MSPNESKAVSLSDTDANSNFDNTLNSLAKAAMAIAPAVSSLNAFTKAAHSMASLPKPVSLPKPAQIGNSPLPPAPSPLATPCDFLCQEKDGSLSKAAGVATLFLNEKPVPLCKKHYIAWAYTPEN